ncbi:MAG: helix-turn-helix domain-containing protein [Baekduia sp.]
MRTEGLSAPRNLARRLSEELDSLAPELAGELLKADPAWVQRGAEAAHVAEDVRLTIDGISAGLSSGSLPATATRGAERLSAWAAEEGIPWETVVRSASRCNQRLLDRVLEWLAAEEWSDAAQAAAAMRTVVLRLAGFGREIEREMAGSYQRTASRLVVRRPGHRQREQIDDLLAGRSVKADELPFELRNDHLAVVAWGGDHEGTLRRLAGEMKTDLTIEPRREHDWAWLHGTPELRDDHKQVIRAFSVPDGCFLAIGGRGSGGDGFATSHRQAIRAARVAAVSGAPVTLFGDVALEAFALADEPLARRFVGRQLGELADDKPRTAALRETLEAYFGAGNRATAAATALAVHERTVSYRIRASEERLGRYLTDCQDDLSLALRLRRLFQP